MFILRFFLQQYLMRSTSKKGTQETIKNSKAHSANRQGLRHSRRYILIGNPRLIAVNALSTDVDISWGCCETKGRWDHRWNTIFQRWVSLPKTLAQGQPTINSSNSSLGAPDIITKYDLTTVRVAVCALIGTSIAHCIGISQPENISHASYQSVCRLTLL